MVIGDKDRRFARHLFRFVVGMVEMHDPEARALAQAALAAPCKTTIRALLASGRGKPWLPSIVDALAEVGVAAAEDVLGGSDDHC
ncbi:MAG: hypothetical protein GX970_05450 [Phyllobacteriaceae bacterium]|nr:hypothetical protein [Phyllobacteriaceae bacterium]